jgi:prepilin-type N-terminal cleavage/methylation domain-containing protein
MTMPPRNAGYSLIEMMIALAVMTVVMAVTMTGMSDVVKNNELVLNMTQMNQSLRIGMDLLQTDMLQVGSGLPPGHVILIPSGAGSASIRLPGPPPPIPIFTTVAGDPDISAVNPQPGRGPVINGHATDVLTVLMADNAFLDIPLTAATATTVTVSTVDSALQPINMASGPDRVTPGQLMMVWKGSTTTLLEVTGVNYVQRSITFAGLDALNLNQPAAAAGNLAAVNATLPPLLNVSPCVPPPPQQAATPCWNTFITRVRMITYYIDNTTDPKHPRLVRRVNNGSPTAFDNNSGTAVAMDIENLTFRFDINDGNLNPANVEMNATDIAPAGTGACAPSPCNQNQIRKVNILLGARSANAVNPKARTYHNTLTSQVSFRGMSFVDEYRNTF